MSGVDKPEEALESLDIVLIHGLLEVRGKAAHDLGGGARKVDERLRVLQSTIRLGGEILLQQQSFRDLGQMCIMDRNTWSVYCLGSAVASEIDMPALECYMNFIKIWAPLRRVPFLGDAKTPLASVVRAVSSPDVAAAEELLQRCLAARPVHVESVPPGPGPARRWQPGLHCTRGVLVRKGFAV